MCENISTSFLPGINPKVAHGFIRQSILCSVYKAQILENVDLPIPLFWLLDYSLRIIYFANYCFQILAINKNKTTGN